MPKYRLSDEVTTEKLMGYGFAVDNMDDNSKNKNFCYTKKISDKTYVSIKIKQRGKKLKFREFSDVRIYSGDLIHPKRVSTIKKRTGENYWNAAIGYSTAMNDLEEVGILTSNKLVYKKKNK